MRRRTLLAFGASALLAGCGGDGSPESRTRETTTAESATTASPRATGTTGGRESTRASTETARASTETTGTPELGVKHEHSFGEWYAFEDWRVTVRSLDLTTTFRVDGGDRTFEMPDGEQLAIATVDVENTAPSRHGWATAVGFVVGEIVHEARIAFDHPEFESEVDVRQLRRVEHQKQFQAHGLPVDGGETARLWSVAVVPRSVTRGRVQVALQVAPRDVRYPVRWTPG